MNTDAIVRSVVLTAIVVGGVYLYNSSGSSSTGTSTTAAVDTSNDIDLGRVLDVTVDTIVKVEDRLSKIPEEKKASIEGLGDESFFLLADELTLAYNAEQPHLDPRQRGSLEPVGISVMPLKDASLLAFGDKNSDQKLDETEDALFLIEVDGQNSRVIATSGIGAVSDRAFSGSGMLTGFLIGNMLSRQSSAGATAGVAQKKTASSTQARARARAGSGSHSRGK